uniref:Uncharacterized protein n=1 Tax=Octopus bimaculoides TaxID=37653 RepID=A0A0L8GS20_OCTBM
MFIAKQSAQILLSTIYLIFLIEATLRRSVHNYRYLKQEHKKQKIKSIIIHGMEISEALSDV